MSRTFEEHAGAAGAGTATAESGPGPTRSSLRRLASDLQDDPVVVETFVSDYLSLLDSRLTRLAQLFAAADYEECVVALLTLETSSAMIGARGVAAAAREMRGSLDQAADGAAARALERVRVAGAGARDALTELGF